MTLVSRIKEAYNRCGRPFITGITFPIIAKTSCRRYFEHCIDAMKLNSLEQVWVGYNAASDLDESIKHHSVNSDVSDDDNLAYFVEARKMQIADAKNNFAFFNYFLVGLCTGTIISGAAVTEGVITYIRNQDPTLLVATLSTLVGGNALSFVCEKKRFVFSSGPYFDKESY